MPKSAFIAFIALTSIAVGQGAVYVPDNQSAVGTCNAIPLQASFASSSTYLARIPAAYMNPNLPRIDDIAFAPCNSATFSAPNLQMGMGHVPNPLPVPFVFPTFDGSGNVVTPGSFIDYHPIWNSVPQGPFTYQMTANAWSPMGFATTVGTTGFIWDGLNDVGFFLTFNGASGGTTCHRTSTEPYRSYSSGTYQAATSSSSGANGLKMEFITGSAASITPVGTGCAGTNTIAPILSTNELPSIGNASFHVDVSQGAPASFSLLYLSIGISAAPLPIGGGCNVYLDVQSVLALISASLLPIGPLYLDAGGTGTFWLGIPNSPWLAGTHAGFQAAVADSNNVNGFTLTNALEAVIQ